MIPHAQFVVALAGTYGAGAVASDGIVIGDRSGLACLGLARFVGARLACIGRPFLQAVVWDGHLGLFLR